VKLDIGAFGNSLVPKEIKTPSKLIKYASVGSIVETEAGGVFRIVASSVTPDKEPSLRISDLLGKTTSVKATDLGIVTRGEARLGRFMRFYAYNSDIDRYVKETIRAAGLPVDDSWNWSAWFSRKFAPYLMSKDPDVQTDAIFDVLANNLWENNGLKKWQEVIKSFPEEVQNLSVEKQITAYLVKLFKWKIGQANRYIRNRMDSPEDVEMVSMEGEYGPEGGNGGDSESETYNILDSPEHATPPVGQEEFEVNSDTKRFRDGFYAWLKSTQTKKTSDNTIYLFDLILEAGGDSAHKAGYKEEWMQATGLGSDSYKFIKAKLYKLIEEYITSHEQELGGDNNMVVRMYHRLKEKKEKVPARVRSLNLASAMTELPDGSGFFVGEVETPKTAVVEAMPPPKDPVPQYVKPNMMQPQPPAQAPMQAQPQGQPTVQPPVDTGMLPHDPYGGGTSDAVVPVDNKPPQPQMKHTVPPELPNQEFHMSSLEDEEMKKLAEDPKYIITPVDKGVSNVGADLQTYIEIAEGYIDAGGTAKEQFLNNFTPDIRPVVSEAYDMVLNKRKNVNLPRMGSLKSRLAANRKDESTPKIVEKSIPQQREEWVSRLMRNQGMTREQAENAVAEELQESRKRYHSPEISRLDSELARAKPAAEARIDAELGKFMPDEADEGYDLAGSDRGDTEFGFGHKMNSLEDKLKIARLSSLSLTEKLANVRGKDTQFGRKAETKEVDPSKIATKIGDISESFLQIASWVDAFHRNLDLKIPPKTASVKERLMAKKNFAASFKRIAEQDPQQISVALNEVYQGVDQAVADLETLAADLGVELQPLMKEPGEGQGMEAEQSLPQEVPVA
jgi:hypothetical protein